MPKYVAKRVAYMVVVFFVISFIMYFIYNLIPGDPAAISLESVRDELTADEYEQMYQQARARLGLDDPIFIRYLRWLGVYPSVNGDFNGVFQGNLGYSTMYKQNVVDVIASPLQNTIFLNVFSTILALVITIPLGIFCAVRKNSKFDQAIQVVTIVGYSIPIYIIGLVFIYLFAVKLQIFPVGGVKTSGVTLTGFAALKDKLYYMVPAADRDDLRQPRQHDALCPRGNDRRAEHGLCPHGASQGPDGKGGHLFPRVAQCAAADRDGHHRLVPDDFQRLGRR